MPGADSYPEGTEALATDSPQRSLVKIVSLLNDGGGGGGAAQTPWAQNIDGGGFNLTNVGDIAADTINGEAVPTTQVFKIAGSGVPVTAPASGVGMAYNETGGFWVYHTAAWQQVT